MGQEHGKSSPEIMIYVLYSCIESFKIIQFDISCTYQVEKSRKTANILCG